VAEVVSASTNEAGLWARTCKTLGNTLLARYAGPFCKIIERLTDRTGGIRVTELALGCNLRTAPTTFEDI
jgi:hypothetical protein